VQKISYLRVIFLLILISPLSCGHFSRPEYGGSEYVPQSEFTAPGEMYKSDEVIKDAPHIQERGPFRLQWPVEKVKINRGFMVGGRREHLGLDIKGRRGDRILAAHDGTVIYAGSKIILEYNDTWATLYGHLNKYRVKTGQQVKAGTIIGEMGRTGRATGVHLHFELMKDKQPVDPSQFLTQGQMAVR
jgi:murein DD-endopeptidase MepM/ murein hydrolase activator NlpD